jgi:hypothetical protein
MRVFLLTIAILCGLALALTFLVYADSVTPDPASVIMVAELNEKVKVYRVEYRGEVCYHTVGYLHGWTVSTDCL